MIRYLLILLLCTSLVFADTVNLVVGASDDDTQGLAGVPSATVGNVIVNGTSCQFGKVFTAVRHVAIRWTGVTIPIGSTIDTVRVTFICSANNGTNTCNIQICAEDTGSATAFTDSADYNARSLTTATVDWNDIPDWTAGTTYTFPTSGAASTGLADVIQEVVDRADWASGNALVLYFYDNSSSTNANRSGASWDNASYDPPEIDIWFTPPAGGPPDHYHGVAGVGVRHSPAGNSSLHKK